MLILHRTQSAGHQSPSASHSNRRFHSPAGLLATMLSAVISMTGIASAQFNPLGDPTKSGENATARDRDGRPGAKDESTKSVLEGDGIRVEINKLDMDEQTVGGVLIVAGNRYPFTGDVEVEDDVEAIDGTFTANGEEFDFTTKQIGEGPVILETGGKRYTLRPVKKGLEAPADKQPQPAEEPARAQPKPDPAPANLPAQGSRAPLTVERKTLVDPEMGGIESHTLLVPKGWLLEGKPSWTPLCDVSLSVKVGSPEGAEVNWVPMITFNFTELSPQLKQMVMQQGNQMPKVGQRQQDGSIFAPPPEDIGQWISTQFITNVRSNVENVKLVSISPMPEAAAKVIDSNPSTRTLLDQLNQQQQAPGMQSRAKLMVYEVVISYDQNGTRFREEFSLQSMNMQMLNTTPGDENNWTRNDSAMIIFYGTWRAPEATFAQQKPILATVFGSMRATPLWTVRWLDLQRAINEARHRAFLERQQFASESRQRLARSNDRSVSDIQMDTWRKNNDTQDELQRKTVNMLTGREDWRDTDGNTVKFDGYYNRGFSNGQGTYVLSDDAMLKPEQIGNSFQEINKLP